MATEISASVPSNSSAPCCLPRGSAGLHFPRSFFRIRPFLVLAIVSLGALIVCRPRSVAADPSIAITRSPLPAPIGAQKTGFTELDPASLGFRFTNQLSPDRVMQFQNMMNGAGIAAGDVDEDGLVDLYFCHKQGSNALLRNLGQGRFTNITESAGVSCKHMISAGALFADFNHDGHLDLVVTSFGGPHAFFLGDGRGKFSDATAASGISGTSGSTSLAASDLDGDGDLDLYWCNFGTLSILRDGGQLSERMVNGVPTVTGRYAKKVRILNGRYYEFGDPDAVFINDGKGRFSPLPWNQAFVDEEGRPMEAPWDFGLAVQIRDVNGDRLPDIYVCNDFQTPDRLWLGDGKGKFRAAPRLALRNMSYASMGVDFADIDRDGHLDFVTVEMLNSNFSRHLKTSSPMDPLFRQPGLGLDHEEFARNALYHNRGDGTWEELACFSGIAATDWSWTALFLDVDLDGWEDLLISNGHLHDVNDRDINEKLRKQRTRSSQGNRTVLQEYPPLDPPKAAFRNRRDLTFEPAAEAWGFASRRIAHGMISADIDGDGDLDILLNCLNGPPLVYRNDSPAPRVLVRTHGAKFTGALLSLSGGPVLQEQEILAGGHYLSSSETARMFAAGPNPMTLTVRLRSGETQVFPNILPNQRIDLRAVSHSPVAAAPSPSPAANSVTPLFSDHSPALKHSHHEEPFDDFAQQPLLSRRLSQLGPGIVVADFDRDGKDDVAIGAGRGGQMEVRWGQGTGAFENATIGNAPLPDDVLGLVWVPNSKGGGTLWAALAHYESPREGNAQILGWTLPPAGRAWNPAPRTLPGPKASPGPLALGDVDADGALELFAGGRVVPGAFPKPADARLLSLRAGAEGKPFPNSENLFNNTGLITGAAFADLNQDGFPELLAACEWGPIRLWKNTRGQLAPWDPVVTQKTAKSQPLSAWTGLWNCVVTADFDGDGRLDFVAGNWGHNSLWNVWSDRPPALFHASFDAGAPETVIEAIWDTQVGGLKPWRDWSTLASGYPAVQSRFGSHQAFASASLQGVLGEHASQFRQIALATLSSCLFLNRGDTFEMRALPPAAQWSPANGLVAADFNGDSHEDLFVAQNQFALRPDDMRIDAGRGLLLLGDGRGAWKTTSGSESGILIYGEQRGCAAGDWNRDGKTDLVVSQNGAPTHLLLNSASNPGLRVQAIGPAENPDCIGCLVRLHAGDWTGPVRIISPSGGALSQNGAVTVLHGPRTPTRVEIQWPGGPTTRAELSPNAKEVTIGRDGAMSR